MNSENNTVLRKPYKIKIRDSYRQARILKF